MRFNFANDWVNGPVQTRSTGLLKERLGKNRSGLKVNTVREVVLDLQASRNRFRLVWEQQKCLNYRWVKGSECEKLETVVRERETLEEQQNTIC